MGRRLNLLLALAVAIVCVPAALDGVTVSNGARAKQSTLKGTLGPPDYLDPQLSYASEGWTAMYETYVPLLTYRRAAGEAGSEVIPGLARGLPRVTDGGRTYTLFLRQGLKYSDGTPVRASDFEHAIKRLFRLESGGSPLYTIIAGARRYQRAKRGGISGIVADNRTGRIVIHLVRPSGTFPNLLALLFAAPVPASTPLRDQTFSPPPATGPYLIINFDYQYLSYKRNPVWRGVNGPLMPQLPDGHVDRIQIRIGPHPRFQVRRVLRGRIDWMQGLPPLGRYAELRRKYGGTRFRAEPTLSAYFFWMNTTKAPFSDLRVRRAANYAVDRSVLRRIYRGSLTPSQQILPPGMPGYRRLRLYGYDLAKARRLVAAADPADREVTVWTDAEFPNRDAAAYYQRQLQRIGLRARLKVVSDLDYFSRIARDSIPDLDTGWGSWFNDYPHPDDFFRPLFLGSPGGGNFARADAPARAASVRRLGRRPLGPDRERRYAALDRSFTKLAPWVSFGNRTVATIVSKRVDLDRIVWNPTFGTALTSLRFR